MFSLAFKYISLVEKRTIDLCQNTYCLLLMFSYIVQGMCSIVFIYLALSLLTRTIMGTFLSAFS
jgi:hypothetical protein